MVHRFQSGEHAHLAEPLEMIFANVLRAKTTKNRLQGRGGTPILRTNDTYQHGRAQIELVEELRDEYVNFQDVGHVLFLHVT